MIRRTLDRGGRDRRWLRLGSSVLAAALLLGGLQLGSAVSGDQLAQAADEDEESAEDEEYPELSDKERAELFAPYEEALKAGQKTAAADALLPILDSKQAGAAHGEAWQKLGDLYREFDMDYSALLAYARAIDADPEVGKQVIGTALDLADELGDGRVLGPVLARNVGVAADKETRSRVAYLAARHNVQNGEFGVAMGMLLMVDKKSDTYIDSEALRGVVLAQQGRYNDALAPLLTAQALGKQAERGERFDNVVALNVARAYFGAGNYPRAVEYYAKVERKSDFWPEAWFEKAWSHFRANDMNGAVSVLMVHESPFYRDWYWPEADLLRAYSLFLMCKFKDATAEIDAFDARYQPVHAKLVADLNGYDAMAGWNDGLALVKGQDTKVHPGVIRDYKKDERFLGAIATVDKAEEELNRLQGQSASPFANRAIKYLRARQTNIKKEEGTRIVNTATKARDELKNMLANLKITKLDMMQFETRQLEQASVTGELDTGDRIGQLRKLRAKPGTRMWPWQGEYWADEVGYYNVVSRPDCPESLRPQVGN